MRILLSTEGTYPYFGGGVSTWAHELISGLPAHNFTVLAVVAHPHLNARHPALKNADVVTIPLWGTESVSEYVATPRRGTRSTTSDSIVNQLFLPAYATFLQQALKSSADTQVVGDCLVALADFGRRYDFRKAFRSERVWRILIDQLSDHPLYKRASIADSIDYARSLFRYLSPLAWRPPQVDLCHASVAAFSALPAIVQKRAHGVPMILTEHGIYLRERVLQLARDQVTERRRLLFINLYRCIVLTAYAHSDKVVPVCEYNTVWELAMGVDKARLSVVHNGLDLPVPRAHPSGDQRRPSIAFVGRLDPLKDIETLIDAVDIVRRTLPDAILAIYGSGDADYQRRCQRRINRLQLQKNVCFMGATKDVAGVYRSCDVAVMSSISEGFPFTVVEAMLSSRPVVSTAVGGVPEALGDADLLVPPRDPLALAAALRRILLSSPEERHAIGEDLRARALQLFSQPRFISAYSKIYGDFGART